MRIDSIYLAGWMPFAGEHDLELPAGPIAVVGEHEGDSRRSNRAGKTSFLEAITWALFGVHRKRLDDQIIHRGADLCEVAVRLDGMVVTRTRARGSSTGLQVNVNGGVLGGAAAQEKIVEVLGLGLDDYLATSCFRQGDVESIVSRTSGERLALVSEWLQLTRWAFAKKVQAVKLAALESRLAAARSSLATLESTVLTAEERELIEQQADEQGVEVERLQSVLVELASESAALAEATRVVDTHSEIRSLRERATSLRATLADKAAALEVAAGWDSQVEQAKVDEQAAVRSLEEVTAVASSGFDGLCPVMCEACPVAAHVQDAVVASATLFEERRQRVTRVRNHRAASVSARTEAQQIVRKLDRAAAEYTEVMRRGRALVASVAEAQPEADAIARLLEAATDHAQRSGQARLELAEASRLVGSTARTLEQSAKARKQVEEIRGEVGVLEGQVRASALALRALSSVPADIARDELLVLEEEANQLLQGNGVSLRFSWARELADKAPSCEQCGHTFTSQRGDQCPRCSSVRGKKRAQELEILCSDGSGLEEDVRFNSGGTRAVVGASIRLAASALLRRLRGSPAAWAIVDEPFGSLDAENREQLARAFAGMLGSVGLEQALVVSHDAVLLNALPSRIVIDKRGEASSVRVES